MIRALNQLYATDKMGVNPWTHVPTPQKMLYSLSTHFSIVDISLSDRDVL